MEWIKVDLEKPNYNAYIWACDKYGVVHRAIYMPDEPDYFLDVVIEKPLHFITHWMPILEPPRPQC